MNMTMQQPFSYPFYMDSPRFPSANPWSSFSFRLPPPPQQHFPSLYPPPPRPSVAFSQQQNPRSRAIHSFSSYSNTRYNHLKKSTRYPNRRPVHRSVDPPLRLHRYPKNTDSISRYQYRPSKTKSVSDLQQIPRSTSAHLSKAHSWHTMANHRQSNLSVSYAKEMHLTPKNHRKRSPKRKKVHPERPVSLASLKRIPSFNNHRKRTKEIPECGVVRISTLDEMPLMNNQTPKRNNSINNDRLSTKGSISNSSKHRTTSKERSKGNSSIKNRKIKTNDEGTSMDIDVQSSSSSSSCSSRASLQRRLNGSLRNDPLIISAMSDFRQLRRASSHSSSLTPHRRNLSRNSLRSDSTLQSSSSISHSNSQSSFTSHERSEIRNIIKKIKTKDPQSSPIPSPNKSIKENSRPSIKPRKSSITEELDREFSKLRALDPDQEITYVTPSSICKRKKTLEKPAPNIPPLPTFNELLRQVQLRPVDKSLKSPSENFVQTPASEETSTISDYENPLLLIPVPQSSPIPPYEAKTEEIKHEYATPMKRTEEKSQQQISHFQPIRNSSFDIVPEKPQSNSHSTFNWIHGNSTNLLPTTFQPNRIVNNQNEYDITSAKGNIYTSDIDVYLPSATTDKNEDDSLQMHLENQTILTDYLYSDYQLKQTTNSSSILDDFSRLFTRKHEQKNKFFKKSHRCSIM